MVGFIKIVEKHENMDRETLARQMQEAERLLAEIGNTDNVPTWKADAQRAKKQRAMHRRTAIPGKKERRRRQRGQREGHDATKRREGACKVEGLGLVAV